MDYKFLPGLFLRAPFYSFSGYDLLRVPEVLAQPYFRNAIFLASPVFYRILEKKGFDFNALQDKEKHTLYKYYNRMCFRPTPFGAFSSFTLLEWGAGSPVRLAEPGSARIHLHPDQDVLIRLNQALCSGPGSTLTLNPTLYQAGTELRFVRLQERSEGPYQFSLEIIALVPFYTELIEIFKNKIFQWSDLKDWMMTETGCPEDEATEYIDFFLASQLLIDRARGHVTAPFSGPGIYEALCQILPADFAIPEHADSWKNGLPEIGLDPGRSWFYAALERPLAAGSLDHKTQQELSAALAVLEMLRLPSSQPPLERFISDFTARFDQEKVPLMIALDPDTGIIYNGLSPEAGTADLLGELDFSAGKTNEHTLEWERVRRLLFKLGFSGRRGGKFAPLIIDDKDLQELEPASGAPLQPSTLAVIFRKVNDHLLIEHAGGATATALIGRFSLFSRGVYELCRNLVEKEKAAHPDILFAEIAMLSDAHADNINRRKQIYDNELPLTVFSDLSPEEQLPLSDLLLSVRGGQLILESQSRKKRVLPRLPTAYNFRKSGLAVYRLLCDLQYQGMNAIKNLDLEQIFPGLDFYPRVQYGSAIFSPAKWKFTDRHFAALTDLPSAEQYSWLRAFRSEFGLPRKISTGHEDQQLVFDLTDAGECDFFISCLQGKKELTLYEYLSSDRTVRSGYKPFVGQFIAFLAHGAAVYEPNLKDPAVPVSHRESRDFPLGSEWLFIKIFCTPRTADRVILQDLIPFISEFKNEIQCWFFIRYTEGGYHLRFRVRLAKPAIGNILIALNKRLASRNHERLIRAYHATTYSRELERYGEDIIELVEELFCRGSDLAFHFILLTKNGKTGWTAFQLATATAFLLIFAFYEEPASAIAFIGKMTDSFVREFGQKKSLRVSLDKKYRNQKEAVWACLVNPSGMGAMTHEDRVMTRLLMHLDTLKLRIAGFDDERRQRLLADLVHMQLNRTFSTDQRKLELVVYYCLHKFLISKQARADKPPVHY